MRPPLALICLFFASACTRPAAEPAAPPSSTPETSAPASPAAVVVNGVPITEAEVTLAMGTRRPGQNPPKREEAIEALVTAELMAQKAEQLGLHEDPKFLAEMAVVQAKAAQARRQTLASRYRLATLNRLPPASSDEVKAFYEANLERIRTELEVQRIVTRTRAEAEQAKAAVQGGEPFEAVAKARSVESMALPTLGFDTVAEAWQAPLSALEPGGVTEVIEMGPQRFAVLRLVDRKTGPAPALDEGLERRIRALLQVRAYEAKQRTMQEDLRKGAKITPR